MFSISKENHGFKIKTKSLTYDEMVLAHIYKRRKEIINLNKKHIMSDDRISVHIMIMVSFFGAMIGRHLEQFEFNFIVLAVFSLIFIASFIDIMIHLSQYFKRKCVISKKGKHSFFYCFKETVNKKNNHFFLDYEKLFEQYCVHQFDKNLIDLKILNVNVDWLFEDFEAMKKEIDNHKKFGLSLKSDIKLNYLPLLMEQDKRFLMETLRVYSKLSHTDYQKNNVFKSCFEIMQNIENILNKSSSVFTEQDDFIKKYKAKINHIHIKDDESLRNLKEILNDLEKEIRKKIQ